MGNDHEEFKQGEKDVQNLSAAGKGFLAHHLNNSLCCVIGCLETGNIDSALKAALHMVDDLNRVGINSGGRVKGA